MNEYNTDISPAIQELKHLHNLLLDHIEAVESVDHPGMKQNRETVISILPGERRREDGWYKWRMWQKKSDSILKELANEKKSERKYHEIYVSGEALSGSKESIVLLMMHQVCHQGAQIQSVQSYHSEWLKIWYQRLFGVPQDAWEKRHEVLGWYTIDQTKLGPAQELVSRLANELEEYKFDLFRVKLNKSESTGKMYKWLCECKTPVVRTGGILMAQCEKCDSPYKLVLKGVRSDFAKRVPDDRKWLA